jgi:hypothetical protein
VVPGHCSLEGSHRRRQGQHPAKDAHGLSAVVVLLTAPRQREAFGAVIPGSGRSASGRGGRIRVVT